MQTGLLREQDLLRNFDQEQIDSVTAVGESRFQLQTKCDMGYVAYGSFGKPGMWH